MFHCVPWSPYLKWGSLEMMPQRSHLLKIITFVYPKPYTGVRGSRLKLAHLNTNCNIIIAEIGRLIESWGWAAVERKGMFESPFLSRTLSSLNHLTDINICCTKRCAWESLCQFLVPFVDISSRNRYWGNTLLSTNGHFHYLGQPMGRTGTHQSLEATTHKDQKR